jgi:uncharacterized protein
MHSENLKYIVTRSKNKKLMNLSNELSKLQELHAAGTLSNEEFSEAKAALIRTSSAIATTDANNQAPPDSVPPQSNQTINLEPNQWAMLLHLSLLASLFVPFSGLVIFVLIWQLKKDEIPQLNTHGRNILNWEISLLIYSIIALVLIPFIIGIPLAAALAGCKIAFAIIAGLKANDGKAWQYPLAIRFLK